MSYGLDRVRDEVVVPVSAVRDPEERLTQIVMRHACLATQGRGAVTPLGDEIRALPPPPRRQLEERMRKYVNLVRDTLVELKATGRLRDVDPSVAAFTLTGMFLGVPPGFGPRARCP